jgi:V/A-type H+-transporting ATPase subunit D
MAEIRVNPTRMEQKKLKARLTTARRGHKLLKDKCDELMRRFLDIVREDKELRAEVEAETELAHKSFSAAASVTSSRALREALALPRGKSEIAIGHKHLMSVIVPTFEIKRSEAAGMSYGFAFTSGELDLAIASFAKLSEKLIKLAELEKTALLLADEIEKTRRRVNALEYIMIPQLAVAIKSITMKLEENERGNLTRLMKVKDMMLERQRRE